MDRMNNMNCDCVYMEDVKQLNNKIIAISGIVTFSFLVMTLVNQCWRKKVQKKYDERKQMCNVLQDHQMLSNDYIRTLKEQLRQLEEKNEALSKLVRAAPTTTSTTTGALTVDQSIEHLKEWTVLDYCIYAATDERTNKRCDILFIEAYDLDDPMGTTSEKMRFSPRQPDAIQSGRVRPVPGIQLARGRSSDGNGVGGSGANRTCYVIHNQKLEQIGDRMAMAVRQCRESNESEYGGGPSSSLPIAPPPHGRRWFHRNGPPVPSAPPIHKLRPNIDGLNNTEFTATRQDGPENPPRDQQVPSYADAMSTPLIHENVEMNEFVEPPAHVSVAVVANQPEQEDIVAGDNYELEMQP